MIMGTTEKPGRTVVFRTLGCKVNQYDTQSIREQFLDLGYREVRWGQPADIYIINTCTVTRTSEGKSLQQIRQAGRITPRPEIVVTGCYTDTGREQLTRSEEIDYIFTNEQKKDIARLVHSVFSCEDRKDKGLGQECRTPAESNLTEQISDFEGYNRAFVKVQDGCESYCSYCIVPHVRGRSRSKRPEVVEREIISLVKRGFKEVVISGVHLGSYGKGLNNGACLPALIDRIQDIKEIERIRLSSLEPLEVGQELIDRLKKNHRMCRHLHLPLQSGDAGILKEMNRPYTPEQYLQLIRNIKSQIEDISLTTDIMVGFPGEDEKAFENTLRLVERAGYSRVHIFPYSPRPGTPAYGFDGRLPDSVISQRIHQLKELSRLMSLKYRRRFLDRTVYPLIESNRDKKTGLLTGYTDTYIRILMEGEDSLKNMIVPAKVVEVTGESTFVQREKD